MRFPVIIGPNCPRGQFGLFYWRKGVELKGFGLLIMAIILIVLVQSVNATVEVTCFDELFQREIMQPRHVQFTFPGSEGPATLKVYNGDGDHWLKRATAAKVKINGKTVLKSKHFKKRKSIIKRLVNLREGDNTIDVTLLGMPGVKFRVVISHAVDADAGAYVGPEGGTISVDDLMSPIYNTKIGIPEKKVDLDSLFSISIDNSIDLPDILPSASHSIKISSTGILRGFIPVSIPLKEGFTPKGRLFVRFYDDYSDAWGVYPISAYDKERNSVTFYTNHLTTFNVFDVQHDNPFLDLTLDVYLMYGRAFLFEHINEIDNAINNNFSQADCINATAEYIFSAVDTAINMAGTHRAWGSAEDLWYVGLPLSIEYIEVSSLAVTPIISETHGKEWIDPIIEVASCILQSFAGNKFKMPTIEQAVLSCGPTTATHLVNIGTTVWTIYVVEGNEKKEIII